jgi:aspartyl-tRNA(Asn)/glutamyl-tRNA(Gln) amidotransferase subunit C
MSDRLTLEEVRHVARLARLRLTDEQLQRYRGQLSTVLDHIAKLNELDVDGVEPMAHPGDLTNRLDEDAVGQALDVEQVLSIAPATEAHFLAVPKVLTDETSS